MYFSTFDFATPEYDEAIKLRHKVLREPLGMEFSVEDIKEEYDQIHLGAYWPNGELAGVLSFKKMEETGLLKMRQVATHPEHQGQGIGTALVAFSEKWARANGYTDFELNAREVAVKFYEKMDYKKVGKRFEEVGIPHFKMIKKLV